MTHLNNVPTQNKEDQFSREIRREKMDGRNISSAHYSYCSLTQATYFKRKTPPQKKGIINKQNLEILGSIEETVSKDEGK
ncbi:MAG: hypothetical protein HRT90_05570 [Candidatus Margulisbacteria bacterium]|nr:hypothetical protein [Candidatus Margulisiibacteriota bacterium]